MHDSIEITKKANGYSVDIMSEGDDGLARFEELVFQDSLDVIVEVLGWLGYDDDDAAAVVEMLDDDAVYVLTDQGRRDLEEMERLRAERERVDKWPYWTTTHDKRVSAA